MRTLLRPLVGSGVVVVALALTPATTIAQGLSVDVSAGRLVYDPVSSGVTTNNVLGTLRFDSHHGGWVYGAGAAPAGAQDTFWMAAGAGGRFVAPRTDGRRATLGADIGGHGFSFRDALGDRVGTGGTFEAMPFVEVAAGAGQVEFGGGWRGQMLTVTGVRDTRAVFETGARASYGTLIRIEANARLVNAAEGAYPFLGGSLAYNGLRGQAWLQAGKWISTGLNDRVWAVGGSVALSARASVWASVRQDGPDPLYWNTARRTWSVGVTQRLGRLVRPLALTPVRSERGGIVIRVRASDAPHGSVSIGGDFNNWQPTPMQREGADWVIRLPLTPGVYNYAFQSSAGTWFVPSSTPGRRDDGMGGDVAVLVVG